MCPNLRSLRTRAARHAKWGVALLLLKRPWARTLRALLVRAGLAPPLVEAHPLALLELAANIVRRFNAADAAGADGRFAEPAVRLLAALPQLRDVGAAYVGPAPAALPLVDLAPSEVTLLLAPDMVLAAPVWGNPYLNGTALRTLLLTDDPSAARIACVGDLRAEIGRAHV